MEVTEDTETEAEVTEGTETEVTEGTDPDLTQRNEVTEANGEEEFVF